MSEPELEGLIETATRVFAGLGFDGTSMKLIADAAGIDVEALTATVGGKAELYRAVMWRAHKAEMRAMEEAVAGFTPSLQGLIDLTDAYLDFFATHPDFMALWIHRWLGDAADVSGLEHIYVQPLADLIASATRDLMPDDVDVEHLMWTVVWCVYGFLSGSMQYTAPHGYERVSIDPETLAGFRTYLHTLMRRMTVPSAT